MAEDIYSRDFKAAPWWWEAWTPDNALSQDPPARTDVAIVGGGYGGMATALELARSGAQAVVLERGDFGVGASTRNGGLISGGINLGKGLSGKAQTETEFQQRKAQLLANGADSLSTLEDIITREKIDCGLVRNGRFLGAYTPRHYADLAPRIEMFNTLCHAGAALVPREEQRRFIGSDYYFGGMSVQRSGHLHPALYYRGLMQAAHRAGAKLCAQTNVTAIQRTTGGWHIATSKGPLNAKEVVVATNGYTTDITPQLKRRLVPVASHIIATEELPADLAEGLTPGHRGIGDTKRVLTYYRRSPDGRRLIFGGRARFTQAPPEVSAPVLYRYMTDRFPQLKGYRITHAWTGNVAFALDFLPHMGQTGAATTGTVAGQDGIHYLLGCNGNGVAMMSYLGTQTGRKIAGGGNAPINAFDGGEFPTRPGYSGNPWFLPLVGAWYRTRDWIDRQAA